MKKLSIVIVTYNSIKDIIGCLNSISKYNDINDELEIIVVDNDSNDIEDLDKLLSKNYPDVILIKNKNNGGYGQGNNIGIYKSSSPLILIMNPDVRLCMPIFKTAIEIFKNTDVVLLGMQQYENEKKKSASFLPKEPSIKLLLLYKIYTLFNYYNPNYFFISGACFFLRKSTFIEIGAFDENIFLYGEETDINTRLLNKYKTGIVFNHRIKYIHPTHSRPLSIEPLKRGYLSQMKRCEKYGLDQIKMTKKYIKYQKLMYCRFALTNNSYAMICKDFIDYLKKELEYKK